jgi:hypothetical protein
MRRLAMLTAVTLLTGAMGCGGVEEEASGDGADELSLRTVEQAYVTWTNSTSEEEPPAHCDGKRLAFGAQCWLSYCDNVRLGCKEPLSGATLGGATWTAAFSEETTIPTICPPGTWVTGVACSGGYCDNVTLECTAVTGRTASASCGWSPQLADWMSPWEAPNGAYLRGAKCTGWWCEKMSWYYCYMN